MPGAPAHHSWRGAPTGLSREAGLPPALLRGLGRTAPGRVWSHAVEDDGERALPYPAVRADALGRPGRADEQGQNLGQPDVVADGADRLIGGIAEGRWADLADLYAEDAVVEQPFAIGAPVRLTGRAAIRAHVARAGQAGVRFAIRDVVIHETADPEVVVAEFAHDVPGDDGVVTAANIQVLRVRNGLIAQTRDYHDHLAIARALGRLPELIGALGAETA